MTRFRTTSFALSFAMIAGLGTACTPASQDGAEAAFSSLQDRGAAGMGVDQYASTHLFDALPDGGRIEFQYNEDDPAQVAAVRGHLQEIQVAFTSGNFSTPDFVHDQVVPGTEIMAARREHIIYTYRELPRGGELRLTTADPAALEAIHLFMAFQRDDHRAGGVDHAAMDHRAMDHGAMTQGAMLPGSAGQGMVGMQGMGGMGDTGGDAAARREHHLAMGDGDPAFATDMELVHQLVTNHRAITRTVEHLPNGIRTLTESTSPAVAAFIVAHVMSMERRLAEGEVFNLFSPTIPFLFENRDHIYSEFSYLETGVAVVQTSEDPDVVRALQAHSEEVTELVDEGMIAMMRGMMSRGMRGGTGGMMGGGIGGMMPGRAHGPADPQGGGTQ